MSVKVFFKYDSSRDITMITVEKYGYAVDQTSMNGKMNSYSKKVIRNDLKEKYEDEYSDEEDEYLYAY